MDSLDQKLLDVVSKLEQLVTQMAEPAFNVAVQAIWLHALVSCLKGFLFLAIAVGCLYWGRFSFERVDWNSQDFPPYLCSLMASIGLVALFGIVAFRELFTASMWIILVDPVAGFALKMFL